MRSIHSWRVPIAALVLLLSAGDAAPTETWSALDVAALIQLRLKLTPQQVSELKAVIEAYARSVSEAIESHRGGGIEDLSALLAELDRYYRQLEAELARVLTPEQLQELEKLRREVRDEVAARLEERAFSGLAERLSLSEEQRRRVLTIYQEDWKRKRELIEQHRGERGRDARREVGREIRRIQKDTEEALEEFLTPQQMSDYRDYRKEQRKKILESLRQRRRQK